LQHVGEKSPYRPRPICASPSAYACIPHHSIKLLASLQQLMCKRFDSHQLCKIHQYSLDFHALLQQQADSHRLAIGFAERILYVCIETNPCILALCRIASGVQDV